MPTEHGGWFQKKKLKRGFVSAQTLVTCNHFSATACLKFMFLCNMSNNQLFTKPSNIKRNDITLIQWISSTFHKVVQWHPGVVDILSVSTCAKLTQDSAYRTLLKSVHRWEIQEMINYFYAAQRTYCHCYLSVAATKFPDIFCYSTQVVTQHCVRSSGHLHQSTNNRWIYKNVDKHLTSSTNGQK